MTAIVAANFDWSIDLCDKAPRDLNYERNTEMYERAMKLNISGERLHYHWSSGVSRILTSEKTSKFVNYKLDQWHVKNITWFDPFL